MGEAKLRELLTGLSPLAQVALTCRGHHLLMNGTTTLIVNALLDPPSSQPIPIALSLPKDKVDKLAEAA